MPPLKMEMTLYFTSTEVMVPRSDFGVFSTPMIPSAYSLPQINKQKSQAHKKTFSRPMKLQGCWFPCVHFLELDPKCLLDGEP